MSHKVNGLQRKDKLCNQQSFSEAFAYGRRFNCPYGLFLIKKNKIEHSRAGVIISKKNIKKSVQRNHLKRLFREWFRLHKQILLGLDLVFVVKRSFAFSEMVDCGEKVIQYAKNGNLLNPRI
jgi:ribonuclease P protein component